MGERLAAAEGLEKCVSRENQDADKRAPQPFELAVNILLPVYLQQPGRQDQVVQAHIRQGQRGDDNGGAGGGQSGHECRRAYEGGAGCQPQGQACVIDGQGMPQLEARPGDRQHRQAEQHQVQGQAPTGTAQVAAFGVLGESHMENVRHAYRAGKKDEQQCPRGTVAHGFLQGVAHLRILAQPDFQVAGAAEHAVHGGHQQHQHGRELYQGFEGNGRHQAGIALLRRDVPGAEQDRENRDDDAEQQCQAVLAVVAGKQLVGAAGHDLDAVGHRLYLQGEQGQQGQAHGHGDRGPYPWTAKAKRQQVGQGRQLVDPAQAQQRHQQQGRHDEHEDHPAVVQHEAVAVAVGQFHHPVAGHGPRKHAQGQYIGSGVVAHPFRDDAPVRQVGNREQAGEIDDDEQQYLDEAKAHPGTSCAGSGRRRRSPAATGGRVGTRRSRSEIPILRRREKRSGTLPPPAATDG